MTRMEGPAGAGASALRITDQSEGSGRGIGVLDHGPALDGPPAKGPSFAADAGPIDQDPGPGGDTVPGDTSTTFSLDIGGGVNGYVNTAGDRDWYAVELTAGQFYNFGLKGAGGAGGLADPLLELRNADGELVASDDDGGVGLNSSLTFVAQETGTYYLAARAFGNGTGQYRLSAKAVEAPDILDSIDWGTTVSDTTIEVYFAQAGETYDGETSLGWNDYEIGQAMLAFQQVSNVVNLEFVQSANAGTADFHLVTNNAGGYLGYFNPPGETNEGVGVFSRRGTGWEEGGDGGLEQGGYGFVTLIHEFGHGLGLAHPHDNGGTSSVMVGVSGPFDSYGLFRLNQGVYTTMSYNDAWPTGPDGLSPADGYGWQGAMMALDVAILQQKYGANTAFRDGNDAYALWDENAPGTMFACIWDGGGRDSITYSGHAAATIDLRAATIDYSPTGGGAISYVAGIIGGYTIAQGVVIENASGGAGDDRLTGNASGNSLTGGAGDDVLIGGDGADVLRGGGGGDTFLFAALETARDLIVDLGGADRISLKQIDANTLVDGNQKFRLVDAFTDRAGQALLEYDADKDRTQLQLDVDGDGEADMRVNIAGDHQDFVAFIL